MADESSNFSVSLQRFSEMSLGEVLKHLPGGGVVDPVPEDIANIRIAHIIRQLPGGGVVDPGPDDLPNLDLGTILGGLGGNVVDTAPDDITRIRLEDIINSLPGGGVLDPSPEDLAHLNQANLELLRHRITADMIRLTSLRRSIDETLQESGNQ